MQICKTLQPIASFTNSNPDAVGGSVKGTPGIGMVQPMELFDKKTGGYIEYGDTVEVKNRFKTSIDEGQFVEVESFRLCSRYDVNGNLEDIYEHIIVGTCHE